jgi:hypothetical protein
MPVFMITNIMNWIEKYKVFILNYENGVILIFKWIFSLISSRRKAKRNNQAAAFAVNAFQAESFNRYIIANGQISYGNVIGLLIGP